eukprot:XP_011421472.1 PREDICTED: talin-2-like isoform X1 [Crassostrea gigas]
MNEQLPLLIQGFRGSETNQDSPTAQLQLMNASKEFIQPASQLVSTANAAAPTVGDHAASMNMNQAVKTMTTALAELRTASGKAEEMCISLEVDAALDQLTELDRELEEYRRAADGGNLVPLPGETVEASAMKLGSTSKNVGSAMAQLLTAASQGNENYVGVAARDTVNALRMLTEATRFVASTSETSRSDGRSSTAPGTSSTRRRIYWRRPSEPLTTQKTLRTRLDLTRWPRLCRVRSTTV